MIDFSKLVQQVGAIAKGAGHIIMDIYSANAALKVEHKADNSPVTKADKTANDCIMEGLKNLSFHAPIISEESELISFSERKNFDYYWLVDPLDGTKEFINRNGEFTVNIALIHQQKAILGVVYAPVFKDLYWAVKDQGAFQNLGGATKKISVNNFQLSDKNLRVVASRNNLNQATQAFIDKLNAPLLTSKGSSLKLLMLANGAADIYPRFAPTMEWDIAAAQIIVEEAGGKVVQAANKKPLVYNKESLFNPSFIAYGNTNF